MLLEEASPILKVRLCLLAPHPSCPGPSSGLDVGSLGPERLSFRAREKEEKHMQGLGEPGARLERVLQSWVPKEGDTPEAEPFYPHSGRGAALPCFFPLLQQR